MLLIGHYRSFRNKIFLIACFGCSFQNVSCSRICPRTVNASDLDGVEYTLLSRWCRRLRSVRVKGNNVTDASHLASISLFFKLFKDTCFALSHLFTWGLFSILAFIFPSYYPFSHFVLFSYFDTFKVRLQSCFYVKVYLSCEHRLLCSARPGDGTRKWFRTGHCAAPRGRRLECCCLQLEQPRLYRCPQVQKHVL